MKPHLYDPMLQMKVSFNLSHGCHDLIGNVKDTYSSVVGTIYLVPFLWRSIEN
uniref:Uncharacterized protein n=1 Tax=Megaselia scalaris TaxID=36166 RepID=T1GZS1_MEGSC